MINDTTTDERPAPERVAAILDAIGELALARGWRRDDVAAAMAQGAGELVGHGTGTAADLDRAVGSIIQLVYASANGGTMPARWRH